MRLDHVGIAVKDGDAARGFFGETLGLRRASDERWRYSGMEFRWTCYDDLERPFTMMDAPEEVRRGSRFELMSSPDPGAFTNRFIAECGEGIHHLTFEVEDMAMAVDSLRSSGAAVREIGTSDPTWQLAAIEPAAVPGILVLLARYAEDFWQYPSREGPVLQDLYGPPGRGLKR